MYSSRAFVWMVTPLGFVCKIRKWTLFSNNTNSTVRMYSSADFIWMVTPLGFVRSPSNLAGPTDMIAGVKETNSFKPTLCFLYWWMGSDNSGLEENVVIFWIKHQSCELSTLWHRVGVPHVNIRQNTLIALTLYCGAFLRPNISLSVNSGIRLCF